VSRNLKRGLGLLGMAVIAWLTHWALMSSDPDSIGAAALDGVLLGLTILGLVLGSVLVVWSLLRH
jgi:hypothetical protein